MVMSAAVRAHNHTGSFHSPKKTRICMIVNMALIHRRKPSAISGRVLLGKARHGPLAAPERAGRAVLGNQARDLLPRVAADLHEHANHDPLVSPGEGEMAESDEGFLYPFLAGYRAPQYRKGHRLGAGHKLGQLIKGGQLIEVHQGLPLPIMNKTRSGFRLIHGRPQFAKPSFHDVKKVRYAAIHPDF